MRLEVGRLRAAVGGVFGGAEGVAGLGSGVRGVRFVLSLDIQGLGNESVRRQFKVFIRAYPPLSGRLVAVLEGSVPVLLAREGVERLGVVGEGVSVAAAAKAVLGGFGGLGMAAGRFPGLVGTRA